MPTPIEWLNETITTTGAAGDGGLFDPQIIGLSNGNFLVVWEEAGTNGIGTSAGADIIGKIFDAEGNVVRDSFRLNSTNTADDEEDFDVAATNDGGFVLVFLDDDLSDPAEEAVIWQRHDASGNATLVRTVITDTSGNSSVYDPQVTVNLLTNQSTVSYTNSAGPGNDTNISGHTVSAAGVVSAEFSLAANSNDSETHNDLAILTGGTVVSVYMNIVGGVFSPAATLLPAGGGGQINIDLGGDPAPIFIDNPSVTALSNGN